MYYYLKTILVVFFSLNYLSLCAQELNIGSNLGYKFIKESQAIYRNEKNSMTFSGMLEFRPTHTIFSVNSEVRCLFEKETIVQFPVYLKFIVGNKIRVCPSLGGFIGSNGNYGIQLGLNLEVPVSEKAIIYSRYEIYSEMYDESIPSHFGKDSKSKAARGANWVGIDIKYNLL